MKKVPFYRTCTVTKFRGGKYALWHARLARVGTVDERHAKFVGAGKNGDLAIADLRKQIAASDKKFSIFVAELAS